MKVVENFYREEYGIRANLTSSLRSSEIGGTFYILKFMPEELSNFEHEVLEADIKKLAAEIKKHQEAPETRNLAGQEILKKSIQSLASVVLVAPAAKTNASLLPDYAADAPAETKLEIEYLLDLAFHKGIEKANAEARKSSPFVLDAFHDVLTTKLYPELQKRGILK